MSLRAVLFALGVALLGIYAAFRVDAALFVRRESIRLEARLPTLPVAAPRKATAAGARATAAEPCCWGRLEIPRVGLSVLLGEGTDELTLLRAAGHVQGTAFPGENGNVAIAGHRDTVFRALRDVRGGDLVSVETPDGRFEYMVTSTEVVTPERVDVVAPTGGSVLTLLTCYPFSYIGPAPKRFVVRARQAGAGVG